MTFPNEQALAKILASVPRWTRVVSAREALELEDHVLLHAGPPLPDPTRPPPPMLNAAVITCLYERWAKTEAEAEAMIGSGRVRLVPGFTRRVVTPLVALISASTTLAEISDGTGTVHAFLGTGAGPQVRFGARDPAIIERMRFREEVLAPGFAELLSSPIDLLSIARSALTEGDELHNRLSSGNAVLHAVLTTRRADSAHAHATKTTVFEAPLYFLNLWMPACQLMLLAAEGVVGSTIVTRLAANGLITGLQLAGLPGRWFTAPAAPVRGPLMKGAPADAAMPPATGDSGAIDAFGLGGQALACAPSLLAAFAPFLPAGDAARATGQLVGMHPVLGVKIGLDAAAVVSSGASPLLSTGMVEAHGRGLLGRGLCAMPLAPFADALKALGG